MHTPRTQGKSKKWKKKFRKKIRLISAQCHNQINHKCQGRGQAKQGLFGSSTSPLTSQKPAESTSAPAETALTTRKKINT